MGQFDAQLAWIESQTPRMQASIERWCAINSGSHHPAGIDAVACEVIEAFSPLSAQVERVALPAGYRVEYGGAAVVSGEFVEVLPPRRLVYLRCLEGVTTRPSRVEIELVPERGGTRVSVHHTDFGPDEGVHRGWPGFLSRLEALLAS